MPDKQVWALRSFEHSGRKLYHRGDAITLPYETEMDQAEVESLKGFGLISETEVLPD